MEFKSSIALVSFFVVTVGTIFAFPSIETRSARLDREGCISATPTPSPVPRSARPIRPTPAPTATPSLVRSISRPTRIDTTNPSANRPSLANSATESNPRPSRTVTTTRTVHQPSQVNATAQGQAQDLRKRPFDQSYVQKAGQAILSIEDAKELTGPYRLQVLIKNVGDFPSGMGTTGYFDLRFVNSTLADGAFFYPDVPDYFWVPGKPKPYSFFGWDGTSELTQAEINNLPSTTRIPRPLMSRINVPPIQPGASVWVGVNVALPDPGMFVRYFEPIYDDHDPQTVLHLTSGYASGETPWIDYIDESKIDVCKNLKEFFSRTWSAEIDVAPVYKKDQAGGPGWYTPLTDDVLFVNKPRRLYVFSPSIFNHLNINPPNKYNGKCK